MNTDRRLLRVVSVIVAVVMITSMIVFLLLPLFS
jgi:hypothetical protein